MLRLPNIFGNLCWSEGGNFQRKVGNDLAKQDHVVICLTRANSQTIFLQKNSQAKSHKELSGKESVFFLTGFWKKVMFRRIQLFLNWTFVLIIIIEMLTLGTIHYQSNCTLVDNIWKQLSYATRHWLIYVNLHLAFLIFIFYFFLKWSAREIWS